MTFRQFSGLGVALATPFMETCSGNSLAPSLDIPALKNLVRHVVRGGADFIVLLGSTGEAATITAEERSLCIQAVKTVCGNCPIVVGTGHNSTVQAIELSQQAANAGADAVLVVTPYYNKPGPTGMLGHYNALASALPDLPIIAYNVPGRTGINLGPDLALQLLSIPQVVSLKESSGNIIQIARIASTLPAGKTLLAGDDNLAFPSIALGAQGLVSVIGNLLPCKVSAMVHAALDGDMLGARLLHQQLLPLMDALFVESNPGPLKAALELLGICSAGVRLPLSEASLSTRELLQQLLADFSTVQAAQVRVAV
ncbi:MAG: 4-hydroxy-tetrahydrodipicolinate synthase [Spirochaetes bacterium]|nr:4-hydroxy-tetrahydrodipicolinate synthase [Spirochaetota bacterium]MBU0955788.1 4-hydroxy-tetrahydrodipicolinate synthase [Spirochaetota bacterium]